MELKEMYEALANSPVTYLGETIDADATEITVMDGSVLPDAPNIATLGFGVEAETIFYAAKDGNRLTGVVRGFQGVKKAWNANITPIARLYAAYDLNTTIENIKALHTDMAAHTEAELPHLVTDAESGAVYRYGFVIQDGIVCFKAAEEGEQQ